MTTSYEWVQNDHEAVETDLTTLNGAPSDLDLTGRTVHFVLRHYRGAKVADTEASVSGTTATVDLTSENLSRPNSHEAEWVITDGPDDPTTLPKGEPIEVDIRPSVDDDDNVAEPLPEDRTVDVLTANGFNGSVTGDSLIESLVAANLAIDASDNLFVPDPAVVSALNGQAIAPQELTLGSESAISGFEGALSVDANGNLVATDTDTSDHSQLTNVQSGQHHSKTTSTDLESGGSDPLNVDGLPGDLVDAQDPKSHDHTGDALTPDTVGTGSLSSTSTNTEELSISDEPAISGYAGALSVDSNKDLVATNTQAYSVSASGSTTLSSGDASVDTGVATDDGYYDVNLNPGAADIGMSLDGSGTNYAIYFEENNTSVGSVTVGWQLIKSEL